MIAVSLGLLALMVSWPFLFPFHTAPIGSFWAEWWAGALGLGAAVFGLLAPRGRGVSASLRLPVLLFIPAVLLVVLLLQFALGRLVFPQLGLLFAVYLLWAGLLMVLGRCLADSIGLARLADVLAAAVAVGALISAAIALMQWLGIANRVPWVFPASSLIWANVAQKNHFAHYSWLGIASLFYLRGRGYLPRGALWLLVLTITFASITSNSRNVFLYLLVLLVALAWARRRDPHGPAAALVVDVAVLLPVLVVLNFIGTWATPRVPEFWAWLAQVSPMLDFDSTTIRTSGATMSGVRLFGVSDDISGVRMAFFRTAWAAFLEYPWLGQGAGNFRWASFVAAGRTDKSDFIVGEHAHNFVFHLLAEFGAPAVIVIILLLALWARQFLRQPWRLQHFWCASVLGFGAVHSMLEYPLWYSHFLGPTALLLGATSSGKTFTLAGRRVTIYLLVAALAGALILGNLRSDYSKLEAIVDYPFAADQDRETAWRISMDRLLKLHEKSLFSPWALRAINVLAEPSRKSAQDRADLCERGILFSAQRSLITRCAMQLAIAGRNVEARKLVIEVLRAFPAERSATSEELENEAQMFPEIKELWELSARQ